jgi:hypothetical protein
MNELTSVTSHSKAKCKECKRIFDLHNETDADEWFYGHDCEASDDDKN